MKSEDARKNGKVSPKGVVFVQQFLQLIKNGKDHMLLVAIVDKGVGEQVIRICGSGTVLPGRGTADKAILEMLGIERIERDVVTCLVKKSEAQSLLLMLNEEFGFYTPGNGIAFTLSAEDIGANLEKVSALG